MTMQTKESDRLMGLRDATVSMLVIGSMLLSMMAIVIPSLAPVSSAQWTPGTPQHDTKGGEYNWTLQMHRVFHGEPSQWSGYLDDLRFNYEYSTPINVSDVLNFTTITMKGKVDRTYTVDDIYQNAEGGDSFGFTQKDVDIPGGAFLWYGVPDPFKFAESGYNVSTVYTELDIIFNIGYLKAQNITEITVRFSDTIHEGNGQLYYSQPLVTSQKVFPDKILTMDIMALWEAGGGGYRSVGFESVDDMLRSLTNYGYGPYLTNVPATVTSYDDGQGGHYNWSAYFLNATGEMPKSWTGKMGGLEFQYAFGTRLNFTSFANAMTVSVKGDTDNTWTLNWSTDCCQMPFRNPIELGYYENQTNPTSVGFVFNTSYLIKHNVKEITVRTDPSIRKWDGEQYRSTPVVTSYKINPKNIENPNAIEDWASRVGSGENPTALYGEMIGMVVFLMILIPIILIGVMVAIIELLNRRSLAQQSRKGPKKMRIGPNGIAETMLRLLDKSELWMRKRKTFILSTTALTLFIYFGLALVVFDVVSFNWVADFMVRWAVMGLVIALSWIILAVYTYSYRKMRADDMHWTMKIRTLKKREGDYLAELK